MQKTNLLIIAAMNETAIVCRQHVMTDMFIIAYIRKLLYEQSRYFIVTRTVTQYMKRMFTVIIAFISKINKSTSYEK